MYVLKKEILHKIEKWMLFESLTACRPGLAGVKGSIYLNGKLELCGTPSLKLIMDLFPFLLTVVKIYFQNKIITVTLNVVL